MLYMNLKVNGKSDGQSVGPIAFLQGRKLKKMLYNKSIKYYLL